MSRMMDVDDGPASDTRDDRFEEEMAELQREAEELARKPSFCEKIQNAIMDAAPEIGGVDNDDLSKRGLALPLILCYFIFWFGALCYFTVTLGLSESRKIFVGLEKSDSSGNTICVEVPLVSTGTYFFDDSGNWNTADTYNYNTSIYKLTFEGSFIGDEDYTALISRYASKVQALGAAAKTRNAAWNWLAWSEFEFKDEATATKLSSNADPNVIFNQDTILTAISSSKGLCTNNRTMSPQSKTIDTQYSGNGFQISYQMIMDPKTSNLRDDGPNGPQTAEGMCSDQGGVQHLWGWSEASSPNFDFSVKFEAQTLMDIIALNMGMRRKESFTYTSSKFTTASLGIPAGNFWLNAEQAPGNPIFCLDDSISKASSPSAPDVCFYAYGTLPVLVYPVMVQFGDCSTGECLPCDCSSDAVIDSVQCNQPQVIFGLFYNIDGSYTDFASGVLKMALDNQNKVVASGDDAIAVSTFKLLASVTQLQTLNSKGNTNNQYCPGGPLQRPNEYGTCNIKLCKDDMYTKCTTDADCAGSDLYAYDAKTKDYKKSGSKMPSTATCQGYCTNGNNATNNIPCSANTDCPGLSGLTCPAYTSTKTNLNYNLGSYNQVACPASTPTSISCKNCNGFLCSDSNSVSTTCCDDTLCCNGNTFTYDKTYNDHLSNVAAEYQSLCGGDRCAAFTFVVDTTTSNFVSLNMWQVSLDGLTTETYQLENNLVYDPNTGTYSGDGTYSPAPKVMCTDVFYRDGAAFQGIALKPPAMLVQDYFRCHSALIAALQAAVGSAAGAAGLYANTAMALVCFIIFKWYNNLKAKHNDAKIINSKIKEKLEKNWHHRKSVLMEDILLHVTLECSKLMRAQNPDSAKSDMLPGLLERLDALNEEKNSRERLGRELAEQEKAMQKSALTRLNDLPGIVVASDNKKKKKKKTRPKTPIRKSDDESSSGESDSDNWVSLFSSSSTQKQGAHRGGPASMLSYINPMNLVSGIVTASDSQPLDDSADGVELQQAKPPPPHASKQANSPV